MSPTFSAMELYVAKQSVRPDEIGAERFYLWNELTGVVLGGPFVSVDGAQNEAAQMRGVFPEKHFGLVKTDRPLPIQTDASARKEADEYQRAKADALPSFLLM